jgi:hypothetical protein
VRTREERWSAKLGPFKTVEERNAAVLTFYQTQGATMQVIAETFGMTRQRVQQIIARQTVKDGTPPVRDGDGMVMMLIRTTDVSSFYALSRVLGRNPKYARRVVRSHGYENAVIRLFAWRKASARRKLRERMVAEYILQRDTTYGGNPLTVDQMVEVGLFPNKLFATFGHNYVSKLRTLAGEAPRKPVTKREVPRVEG